MVQIFLIGLGAGIAAALLFASIATGALISLLLFYLAPLPILIAGLGWSHWAGLVAALAASLCLATTFSLYLFIAFLVGIGLPAWWLSYLALLARPVTTPAGSKLEWYPIGRLVIWVAILSALIVVAAVLSIGTSEDTLRVTFRGALEGILRQQVAPADVLVANDINRQIDVFVTMGPPIGAAMVTLINLMLLWLAGRIVNVSNRLRRPWPDLSAIVFPALTPNLLVIAMVCLLLAGFISIIASVFAASLLTAYAVLGFAVLHAITREMQSRGLLLGIVYVSVVFILPVLLLIALLGLADTALHIRDRMANKRGPPTLRT